MIGSQPWLNTLTGTRIRIQTPGSQTDNRLTIIEYIEPPHSVPPIFTQHEFIEVFCVQSGELAFQFLGESKLIISAGQNITCPSWKPHSFWNENNDPATVLLVCTPAGLDQFFIESNELLSGARSASSSSRELMQAGLESEMQALRLKYGLEHVGEPPER